MVKEFNSLEEIQKYYDKNTNTYVFKENGIYINLVKFNFNLRISANIDACDIKAGNIKAIDIDALDINAFDINAWNVIASDINARNIDAENIDALDIIACGDINALDISYHALCFAYNNIKCKSITSFKKKAKHFVLDGKLEVEEDD